MMMEKDSFVPWIIEESINNGQLLSHGWGNLKIWLLQLLFLLLMRLHI